MTELEMGFRWRPVRHDAVQPYQFPSPISRFTRSEFSSPAIYRWSVKLDENLKAVYYGETENLATRLDGYRRGHPGQQTNHRLNEYFNSLSLDKHCIDLDVLIVEGFTLNGFLFDASSLSRKEVRCFIESALMMTMSEGGERLNRSHSVESKRVSSVAKKLSKFPIEAVKTAIRRAEEINAS